MIRIEQLQLRLYYQYESTIDLIFDLLQEKINRTQSHLIAISTKDLNVDAIIGFNPDMTTLCHFLGIVHGIYARQMEDDNIWVDLLNRVQVDHRFCWHLGLDSVDLMEKPKTNQLTQGVTP